MGCDRSLNSLKILSSKSGKSVISRNLVFKICKTSGASGVSVDCFFL